MRALYARISTSNQNIERQLKKDKSIEAFIDVCSGAIPFKERKEGKRLLSNKRVKEVHIKHIDRLGRNLKDILETVEVFTNKGVNIFIEDLGINTLVNGDTTPTAKLIISMFGAVAELERNNINERTQQGREIAKAKGVYKGRKRGASSDIQLKNEMLITWIQSKIDENLSIQKISDISKEITPKGVSRTTIYNYIKKGLISYTINNEDATAENEKKLLAYLNNI